MGAPAARRRRAGARARRVRARSRPSRSGGQCAASAARRPTPLGSARAAPARRSRAVRWDESSSSSSCRTRRSARKSVTVGIATRRASGTPGSWALTNLPPQSLVRAQLVGQRAHAVEHRACQQRIGDVDVGGLQIRQRRHERRYARQPKQPVAPGRQRFAGGARQPFRQSLAGKLERFDLARREVVGERREARLGARGIRRPHVHGAERMVAADHAVEAFLEQRLPHPEAVDVSGNPVDAPFADGEEPLEDRLGIGVAARLDRNEPVRHAENACDLARDLRVVAVFVLAVRQSPRDRSDAAVAQQTEQAAAVRAARQCQHPLARVERPAAARVGDGRAQALAVGVVRETWRRRRARWAPRSIASASGRDRGARVRPVERARAGRPSRRAVRACPPTASTAERRGSARTSRAT